MDYLQEGISLRAYAQRDPVVEYQREGFDMFQQMLEGIKEEAVGFLFNLEVQVEEAQPAATVQDTPSDVDTDAQHVEIRAKGLGGNRPTQALQYSAPTVDGEAGTAGVVIEQQEQAPALGLGTTNGKPSPNGSTGARRSGPPSPTTGARKPSPGQVVGGGGPARNAPCPCGSGKKYKRCHGAPTDTV